MGTTFFRFVTNHAFDRQTDGRRDRQTDSFLVARPRCSAVKTDDDDDDEEEEEGDDNPWHYCMYYVLNTEISHVNTAMKQQIETRVSQRHTVEIYASVIIG